MSSTERPIRRLRDAVGTSFRVKRFARGQVPVAWLPLLLVAGLVTLPRASLASDPRVDSLPLPSLPESSPPRDIVLLLVDTLRQDAIGIDGAEMPGTFRRFEGGLVFENCQSQCPWTKPSVATLFTGLYPTAHGALRGHAHAREESVALDPLRDELLTLAEFLGASGYSTFGIQTNPNLIEELGFAQGFSRYQFDADAPAERITDLALSWVAELDGDDSESPSFLYLHYLDPHLPYERHDEEVYPDYAGALSDTMVITDLLQREFTAEDRAYLEALYWGEVHHVDREISRFIDALSARTRWKDTLLILVSDHGEEFWEHGGFEHGHTLYDELLRVPLLIGGGWMSTAVGTPSTNAPALIRRPEQVRILDLLPTLLDLVDCEIPGYLQGESFAGLLTSGTPQEISPRTSFSEGLLYQEQRFGVRTESWKEIMNLRSKTIELYDARVDRNEMTNLSASNPEIVAELRQAVGQWYTLNKAFADQLGENAAVPLDPETRERLRSLGYIR